MWVGNNIRRWWGWFDHPLACEDCRGRDCFCARDHKRDECWVARLFAVLDADTAGVGGTEEGDGEVGTVGLLRLQLREICDSWCWNAEAPRRSACLFFICTRSPVALRGHLSKKVRHELC